MRTTSFSRSEEQLRQAALRKKCAKCGARPGEKCRSMREVGQVNFVHQERIDAVPRVRRGSR